jgi:predicted enzyme related to lactoylglutathione lyase
MTSEAQLVTGVDFVAVPTRDLEQAIRFYRDTLGLRCSAYKRGRSFAELETGNLTLSVIVPENMGMEHFTSPAPTALHVEDIEAARSRLQAAGIEFHGDTFDTGVCHMAFFSDLNGNALMLHSRSAPRETDG